jgi:hypothetical protein
MKRTTLSLPDDLAQALSREARRRQSSVSEVAREALAKQMGLSPGKPRELPFAAVGNSGTSDTAENMEELLRREWDGATGRS